MQLKCFYQIRPIFAVAKARATLWVAVLCSTVLCTLPPAKVPEYIFVPSSFLSQKLGKRPLYLQPIPDGDIAQAEPTASGARQHLRIKQYTCT